MAINRFDGPIPGQSLTTPKGNAKWEKPPQFTNKDKALDFLLGQLTQPAMAARLIAMLDSMPIEAVVRVLLFGGFTDGRWNPDLMILMATPLAGMIATIYYGIKHKRPPHTTFDDGKPDQGLVQTIQATKQMQPKEPPITTPAKKTITDQLRKSGILGAK